MAYSTRHSIRDKRLPKIRKALLNKIVNQLKFCEEIEGIFIGGSIARGNEDLYSDIDLRIVVGEDRFESYVENKKTLMAQFGEVAFFEDLNPTASFTIAHYANFIKVDLFIYTFGNLSPSIWLKEMKVVYDPSGQLNEIGQASNEITYQVSKEEVESWRGKVFSYFHEVYRRTQRQEYYYALTMINNLRSFVVHGWNMEENRHSNAAWDWSKIEGARSELADWQLSLLSSWTCGRNPEEIMKTTASMVPELRRLHGVLCLEVDLAYSQKHFDQMVNQVL